MDDDIPPNNTLDGLLRKLEDGRAINELGADVQTYIKDLRVAAKKKGGRLIGEITFKIKLPMGADGYMLPSIELKTKAIPKPARPESILYTDEDGDINGMPVPKQHTIFTVAGGKNTKAKDPAAQPANRM